MWRLYQARHGTTHTLFVVYRTIRNGVQKRGLNVFGEQELYNIYIYIYLTMIDTITVLVLYIYIYRVQNLLKPTMISCPTRKCGSTGYMGVPQDATVLGSQWAIVDPEPSTE